MVLCQVKQTDKSNYSSFLASNLLLFDVVNDHPEIIYDFFFSLLLANG